MSLKTFAENFRRGRMLRMIDKNKNRKFAVYGGWFSLFLLGLIFYLIQINHPRKTLSNTDAKIRNSFFSRMVPARKSQKTEKSQRRFSFLSGVRNGTRLAQTSEAKKRFQEKFEKFQKVSEITLKSQKQREEYRELLQDAEIHEGVLNFLLNPVVEKSEDRFISKRIDAINFWNEALSWRDNPAKSEIAATIGHFITQVSFPVGASDLVKKAIVGDQMEAYMILLERSPEAAQELVTSIASDSRLARVIQFAANFYQHQKNSGQKVKNES